MSQTFLSTSNNPNTLQALPDTLDINQRNSFHQKNPTEKHEPSVLQEIKQDQKPFTQQLNLFPKATFEDEELNINRAHILPNDKDSEQERDIKEEAPQILIHNANVNQDYNSVHHDFVETENEVFQNVRLLIISENASRIISANNSFLSGNMNPFEQYDDALLHQDFPFFGANEGSSRLTFRGYNGPETQASTNDNQMSSDINSLHSMLLSS